MSNADPFREIVKQNAKLYRDSEEAREVNATQGALEYAKWKRDHEIYVRAAKSFAVCENSNLADIGIYEEKVLGNVVDNTDANAKMVQDEGRG
jgi:hypothetical protein